jgi:hypothetical protein
MATRGRPKKRVTTTVEHIDVEEHQDQERDISGILKSLSPAGKWTIKIWRMLHAGAQEWLSERSPEEISERMLAEEYGEGRYLIRPWDQVDQKWGPSKVVHISAEADGVKREAVVIPSGNGSNNFQIELMKLQMTLQQAAADRQFQMMNQFQAAMVGIITAMVGAQKPQDLASIVSIVKDMNGGGNNIAALKDIVGLAKELAPGGSSDTDPMMNMLTMVVPKILDRGGQGAPPPAAIPAAQLAPPAAAVSAETTAPQPNRDERWRFLQQLKAKAQKNADVEFWADYIEENEDEEGPAAILAYARAYPWDQVLAGLVQVDADLANDPCRTWFHRLYNALTAPEEAEVMPTCTCGDTAKTPCPRHPAKAVTSK